jgi:hypothetical protein
MEINKPKILLPFFPLIPSVHEFFLILFEP